MSGVQILQNIDRLLTPERAFWILVLLGAARFGTWAIISFVQPDATSLGGDFIAFWAAGRETLAGNMADLYPAHGLADAIAAHAPPIGELPSGLTWQYPPHATLFFSPFGSLPYVPAFFAWCGLGLAAYVAALRELQLHWKAVLALLATSAVFIALINGQNGLLTAALLIPAVTLVDRRPVLAGLAAAALTIKPQIGLLLPIAYLAARAWTPFLTAALASLVLWGKSALIAGKDSWLAFAESLTSVGAAVDAGIMPLYKMVTFFSALRLAGVPSEIAMPLGLVLGLAIAAAVGWVWMRTTDIELRLAAISAAALLVAPYAYYYELTVALPAIFLIA
ncbi:MAG: glycosyltransferase family 87 protein, partial [Pseudomonadota bacterium]